MFKGNLQYKNTMKKKLITKKLGNFLQTIFLCDCKLYSNILSHIYIVHFFYIYKKETQGICQKCKLYFSVK